MNTKTLRRTVASAAVAAAMFGASAASAVTVSYSQFVTGDDLGSGPQATLTYNQNGNDVDFSLTNSLSSLSTAFISSIGFTYSGTLPTEVVELDGSEAGVAGLGSGSSLNVPGEDLSVDAAVLFVNNNSGAGRLTVGETALFRILNAQETLFNFSSFNTGIRGQGLDVGEGSTKYTAGDGDGGTGLNPAPVPLPAGLPMLVSAFLGMAYLRKRKLAA